MSKIKIGIVEDEAIIADNLSNTLTQLGYDVAEPATSYAEAITMIETEKPDLLLLDIQLKGKKDGIDLAMKIKEDYHLPFIFLLPMPMPQQCSVPSKQCHPLIW